ncbi:MAG: hypothetical protein HQL50_10230 [Magnetococcales bacterium]|nr:hypothetical protein [Magnetococcales bacterium]
MYNEERPHEALGNHTPIECGRSIYTPMIVLSSSNELVG